MGSAGAAVGSGVDETGDGLRETTVVSGTGAALQEERRRRTTMTAAQKSQLL